jgi:hypothetical protein
VEESSFLDARIPSVGLVGGDVRCAKPVIGPEAELVSEDGDAIDRQGAETECRRGHDDRSDRLGRSDSFDETPAQRQQRYERSEQGDIQVPIVHESRERHQIQHGSERDPEPRKPERFRTSSEREPAGERDQRQDDGDGLPPPWDPATILATAPGSSS